jgi:hypothetical protein
MSTFEVFPLTIYTFQAPHCTSPDLPFYSTLENSQSISYIMSSNYKKVAHGIQTLKKTNHDRQVDYGTIS